MRTPRGLALAFVAAGLAIALVWFVAIYRPQGDRISELQDEVAAAEAEEQSLRATLDRLQAVDADRPSLEAELRRLTAAVPPTPELAGFILSAHDAAGEAGIDFMSITPAPPVAAEAEPGLATIALGVTAEGRFFSVLDFLHRLEELERVLVIDSVTLTRVPPTEPEQETAAAAFTGGGVPLTFPGDATGSPEGTIDLTFPADGAGAGTADGGLQPRAVAQTVEDLLVAQVAEEHRVALQIQARAFTTAVPVAPEGEPGAAATTTTTAPGEEASLGARRES